jgi:cytochrome b6-f complex iron-sulfur subunit
VNRREFLERLEAAAGGALCSAAGLSLGGCLGFHYVTTTTAGNRLLVNRAELGSSRFALLDAPSLALPLYLYRLDDGNYSAVSTRCMHRGCQVEPVAGHLVCPCHGSEYSNTGEVLKGPTELPLRTLPVAVEGETIVIELPAVTTGW